MCFTIDPILGLIDTVGRGIIVVGIGSLLFIHSVVGIDVEDRTVGTADTGFGTAIGILLGVGADIVVIGVANSVDIIGVAGIICNLMLSVGKTEFAGIISVLRLVIVVF